MLISERIFDILKEKRITQKEFSEKTGISQSTISDWKRKKTNPSADKIISICDALGVSVYELLQDDGNSPKLYDHCIMVRDSDERQLLEGYHSLDGQDKARILGYMAALKEVREKNNI